MSQDFLVLFKEAIWTDCKTKYNMKRVSLDTITSTIKTILFKIIFRLIYLFMFLSIPMNRPIYPVNYENLRKLVF